MSAQIVVEDYETPFLQKPVVKSLIAPTILTAVGLFTLKQEGFLNKYDLQEFFQTTFGVTNTNLDNYLAFTPMVSVTGLNWSGVKPKNDWYNRNLMLIKSEIIMAAVVYGFKYTTHELRPDSSDYLSFPSGHTAQAFLSAAILDKEFRDKSIFYSIAGYATATTVGVLRILNNRHWTPDVLVGAAVGILSVNMVYLKHRHRVLPKKFRGAYLYPYSNRNLYGMGLMWNL